MDDSARTERDPAPESLRVPDPQTWAHPPVRQALTEGDIGRIYRILHQDHGYDPAWIGALTGQSQPEVMATMQGRRVLALPRGWESRRATSAWPAAHASTRTRR